jgi:hypothetical protein
MLLFAHLLICKMAANNIHDRRNLSLTEGRPVGPVDVLQVVILFFFSVSLEFICNATLSLSVILEKQRMDMLHTHPWVVAPGIDVQGPELVHLNREQKIVFSYFRCLLPYLNSGTCHNKRVINFHEILPFVHKRSGHSVVKLANKLVLKKLVDV